MTQSTNRGGTGRCLCGAVQYRYEGEPITIGLCQCDRCQRQSGSAFLIGVIFPRASSLRAFASRSKLSVNSLTFFPSWWSSRATALPTLRPQADLLLAAIGFVSPRENDIHGPSAGGESSRWTDCQATDWTSCVVGSSSYCSDDYGGMVAKRKIIGQPVSAKRCRV